MIENKKNVPILETNRLYLRGILPEDTDNIVKWRSNPDVYPFFLVPHPISKKDHVLWYNHQYLKDPNRFDWICLRKDTHESIGVFGMKKDNMKLAEAEISYLISPNVEGCGFAKEAVKEIIRWCKENGIIQLKAIIHEDNDKSINFIKSMGFLAEGNKEHFITFKQV